MYLQPLGNNPNGLFTSFQRSIIVYNASEPNRRKGTHSLRVFVYSLIGIPLLLLDAVLLYTLPACFSGRITLTQTAIAGGGVAAYLLFHLLIRKPERLYLWGHEFTHLIAAKIFLRQVHGFHITSKTGGKVVIDRTNVVIDLAPYAIPFYCLLAVGPALLFRSKFTYIREIYLAISAFFFMMHLYFSLEGFVQGQSDLKRSGRVFSGAIVLLCLLLLIPILWAPATRAGFHGITSFYGEWFNSGFSVLRRITHHKMF